MKKNLFILVAFVAGVCVMTSCGGSSKAVVAPQPSVQPASASFSDLGPTKRFPLMREATEEEWYEVGTAVGPKARMSQVRVQALRNARQLIRESMSEAYKGLVSEYSNMVGNNIGTDYQEKAEAAGDRIIDAVTGQLPPVDEQYNIDEKGNITFFRLVKMSKKELADKIVDAVSNDEELRLRFKEQEFRKYMQEKFKEFGK